MRCYNGGANCPLLSRDGEQKGWRDCMAAPKQERPGSSPLSWEPEQKRKTAKRKRQNMQAGLKNLFYSDTLCLWSRLYQSSKDDPLRGVRFCRINLEINPVHRISLPLFAPSLLLQWQNPETWSLSAKWQISDPRIRWTVLTFASFKYRASNVCIATKTKKNPILFHSNPILSFLFQFIALLMLLSFRPK